MSGQAKQQLDMFRANQGDLFGGISDIPKPHVPKQEHVRNSLVSIVERMEAAQSWPFSPAVVRMHKNGNFDYLCGLITDAREAQLWRARIVRETARLDGADADLDLA